MELFQMENRSLCFTDGVRVCCIPSLIYNVQCHTLLIQCVPETEKQSIRMLFSVCSDQSPCPLP